MKKRKLIRLLQSLSEPELSGLERFLASPLYNEDEQLIRLFALLRKNHPEYQDPELTKKKLFRQLFPAEPYQDKQLRYLFSDLNKLAERFVALQKIGQHPYQLPLALAESLSERGLEKAYRQVNRQLEKNRQQAGGKSSDLFFMELQWSGIRERHFEKKRLRRYDPSLQHLTDDLDKYYFLTRLKTACAMLDRQTIFQADYELKLSGEWISHLESRQFFGEAVIEIYYIIFQALRHESEERHFRRLKASLQKDAADIAPIELQTIYLFAINYCARKIRKGKEAYVTEALNLYRAGIESELLIDENGLSPWAFTNVVKLSLRLGQYEYIESFIPNYAPQLPEAFRENALHYNLAELYYYTDRYEAAREHLVQVAYSDLNYYLGARVLLAKIYYETGEEEALLSLISSFTIFLKRNKHISGNLKHTYLNFCQILFQIVRRAPATMKRLPEKISSSTLLTDRAWLERIYREATADAG